MEGKLLDINHFFFYYQTSSRQDEVLHVRSFDFEIIFSLKAVEDVIPCQFSSLSVSRYGVLFSDICI